MHDIALKPAVSVVIATYGRGQYLLDTVHDLLRNNALRFELIVVDQSETLDPPTMSTISALCTSGQIDYVAISPPNLPYARNVGLGRARGDIIVYCDDDVRVGPDFLAHHVAAYRDPEVGGLAGRVLLEGAGTDGSTREHDEPVGRLFPNGNYSSHFHSEHAAEVDFGMGCNMSFRRTALTAIGGFDERYRVNFFREEGDAFARIRRSGYRVRFEPRAVCVHRRVAVGGARHADAPKRLLAMFCNETLLFLNVCSRREAGSFLVRMSSMIRGNWHTATGLRGLVWPIRAYFEIARALALFVFRRPDYLSRRYHYGLDN
jgi:GT2 family glycosyltransferase